LEATEKEIQKIKKLPFVKNVYLNYKVKVNVSDSVPLIGGTSTWNLGFTGTGTVIAILDTGIDYTHPDLGNCTSVNPQCKIVGGYDFVNNDDDPMDDHGHGTHVAGIAAANGTLKGVAPDAKLLAYKVLDSLGYGFVDDVISAIERSLDPNQDGDYSDMATVINLSFSSPGYFEEYPLDPLTLAINRAVLEDGVIVVASAGNEGPDYQTIGSPGTAEKAITVGATTKLDEIADFSSRGPVIVPWVNFSLLKPDVVAPGVAIVSTVPRGNCSYCDPSGYMALSGTSMAAHHVAGAAALIKQAHPDWTPNQIKMALRNTAVDVGEDFFTQGFGRINVFAALQSQKPPFAYLSPIMYEIYGNEVKVLGSAQAENFGGFEVYYGQGKRPKTWILIATSTQPPQPLFKEGDFFCNFDTFSFPDGEGLLKLVVKDQQNQLQSADLLPIKIENVVLNFPLNNDIYRLGEKIEVKGRILGYNFQNYQLEYKKSNEDLWQTFSSFNQIPQTEKLGFFETKNIKDGGFYDLKLVVNFSTRTETEEIKNLYLDPSLREGWPKRINWEESDEKGIVYWGGFGVPVVEDINKDGKKEIIIYFGGVPPKIFVFKDDGSLLWSKEVGEVPMAGMEVIPVVGDLNDDGFDEIVVYARDMEGPIESWRGRIFVFSKDGSLLLKSDVFSGETVSSKPTIILADLNLDGKKEIVIQRNIAFSRKMVILDGEGKKISEWSLPETNWGASILSTPAVGNFDDDEQLEIVSVTPVGSDEEGSIYIYNIDGSVLPGFPKTLPGLPFSSPAVGDINKDGKLEIVVGLFIINEERAEGGLYVFDKNGNILPGFPVLKKNSIWSSPSLADFDSDGDLEIVVSDLNFKTYIFHHDGTLASGWPKTTCWADYYSTVVADVDGDNIPDVLTTAGSGVGSICYQIGGVYAWKFDGTQIQGFPKITEVDAQAPAVVSDIDGDSKLELIASSDFDFDFVTKNSKNRITIYVWNLETPDTRETMKWPTFHHDVERTGLYQATGLKTFLISFDKKTTPPFSTNNQNPEVLISGKYKMKCRWNFENLSYSQMPKERECETIQSQAVCTLKNLGEDGEKTVFISCQDEYGNDQKTLPEFKNKFCFKN